MFAVYYSTTSLVKKIFLCAIEDKQRSFHFCFCISNCGIVFLYMNIFEFHEHRNSLNKSFRALDDRYTYST